MATKQMQIELKFVDCHADKSARNDGGIPHRVRYDTENGSHAVLDTASPNSNGEIPHRVRYDKSNDGYIKTKRCNINTNITPRLINNIREIEFGYFYKAGLEWIETLPANIQASDDNGNVTSVDMLKDIYSTKEKAYNAYTNVDFINDRAFAKYRFNIIVPILQLVLITDGFTDEELELVNQPYEEVDDNFWYNQLANNLLAFYVELKKNIT